MRQTRALPACLTAKTLKNSHQPSAVSSQFLRGNANHFDACTVKAESCEPKAHQPLGRLKLFLLDALSEHHRQIPARGIEHRG